MTTTIVEPTYHDFSWLGLKTAQIPGIYGPNQKAKAPVLAAYILTAFARLKCDSDGPITFAELFCADGFYAMFAAHFGASRAIGFDNDRDGHLAAAARIRDLLRLEQVSFVKTDIEAIDPAERFSVVANVGGLYHVEDPVAVLKKSYEMATDFLIVQSVVSMASTAPDYFAKPAPGLTWGNRFSRESFDKMMAETGWKVVDRAFNLLVANERLEDRGSVYYLIDKRGR
jgi:predicted RNA methylase